MISKDKYQMYFLLIKTIQFKVSYKKLYRIQRDLSHKQPKKYQTRESRSNPWFSQINIFEKYRGW